MVKTEMYEKGIEKRILRIHEDRRSLNIPFGAGESEDFSASKLAFYCQMHPKNGSSEYVKHGRRIFITRHITMTIRKYGLET